MNESADIDLFPAIKAGDLDRVRALVGDNPALVDARNSTGESAILTAVYNGRKDIANLLVARGATLTLFEACAAGEFDRVERLLASGSDVNAFSADGWTPLHLAAFFGYPKVAELLLEHDADVTARSRNANGNTPLHAALASNQRMVAGLLVGRGADVNAVDAAGWAPLHLASANGNLEVIKMLIAQGAKVDATNGERLTPLALAERRGHREVAAHLRRYSAP